MRPSPTFSGLPTSIANVKGVEFIARRLSASSRVLSRSLEPADREAFGRAA